MLTLPTFLPLSEAARKYGLDEARLRQLVEAGKIRAGTVTGEVVVSEEEVQKRAERERGSGVRKEDLPEYRKFSHLCGNEINIRKASEKYSLPFSTLQGWVSKGVVKRIRQTEKDVFIDEADVAYCNEIYKKSKGRGRRTFNADGTPYQSKVSSSIL